MSWTKLSYTEYAKGLSKLVFSKGRWTFSKNKVVIAAIAELLEEPPFALADEWHRKYSGLVDRQGCVDTPFGKVKANVVT